MRTYIWIRGTIINAIYHQVRSAARFDRPPYRAVPSPTFLISFSIYLIVLLLPSAVIYSLIRLRIIQSYRSVMYQIQYYAPDGSRLREYFLPQDVREEVPE